MKKSTVIITLFFWASAAVCQIADRETESNQITVSIGMAYFAAPWDDYNATLATVTHHIRLDSYYYQPRGKYDKITGDLLRRISLGYQFYSGLQLRVTGQTGTVKSTFETYPDASIPDFRNYPSWRSDLDATFSSYGLELAGEFSLTERISLHAAVGIDQWHARIGYRSGLDYWLHAPVPDEFSDTRASFKDAVVGYHAGIGTAVRIYGPVSFTLTAVWRDARFDDLRGSGQHEENGQWIYFDARLVRSTMYFGPEVIRVTNPNEASYEGYQLRRPRFYYPFYGDSNPEEKPLVIDLAALGLQFGFNVEF